MTYEERKALREQGHTLQEIADMDGVSKQAVHTMLRSGEDRVYAKSLRRIVYPRIYAWMREQHMNIAKLNRAIGIKATSASHNRMSNFLSGRSFHKDLVDGILRVSGMTYEEAFGE